MREGQKRDFARLLRRNMTDAERALWRCLRMKQLEGFRFRRQVPVGPYIVDFACLDKRLVIEVDGGQHCDSPVDPARDAFLRRQGFRILRIWNNEALANPAGVCEVVIRALAEECPIPTFPQHAGQGDRSDE